MPKYDRSPLENFIRGAEIWRQQAMMLTVSIVTMSVVGLLAGLVVTYGIFSLWTTDYERYLISRHVAAKVNLIMPFSKGDKLIPLNVGGDVRQLPAKQVEMATREMASEGLRKLQWSILIGVLSGGVMLIVLWFYWVKYGRDKLADEHLRGAQLVTAPELTKQIVKAGPVSSLQIAGVPIPENSRNLHFLFGGATGTGKSNAIGEVLDQYREQGLKTMIFDPAGEFCERFYRAGKDVILNPLDVRSPAWSIDHEIRYEYDYPNFAEGLYPDPGRDTDPFFAKAARAVFEDAVRQLINEDRLTNSALHHLLGKLTIGEIFTVLEKMEAGTYVDPKAERTAISVLMTVKNGIRPFRYLHDKGDPFSIRSWVESATDEWLFVTMRESQKAALRPLLSLWVDIAVRSVTDLPKSRKAEGSFVIDELQTLQKIEALELGLTNTRKYGWNFLLGVQGFSQLEDTYGPIKARTLISMCQNKLLLRVTDEKAAEDLAKLIGEAEILEVDEGISYGVTTNRDGMNIHGRRNHRKVVLPSQIVNLPELSGYLSIAGEYPIARVDYKYTDRPKIAEDFILRDGFSRAKNQRDGSLGGGERVVAVSDEHGQIEIDPDTGEIFGYAPTVNNAPSDVATSAEYDPLADSLPAAAAAAEVR